MWLEQQCDKIDVFFKVNQTNYVYCKIQQFVGKQKLNCTNNKDKNDQLLYDGKNIVK